MMDQKVYDYNTYRKIYYAQHPDKQLTQEIKCALSLLHRLGYEVVAPSPETLERLSAEILASRKARKQKTKEAPWFVPA